MKVCRIIKNGSISFQEITNSFVCKKILLDNQGGAGYYRITQRKDKKMNAKNNTHYGWGKLDEFGVFFNL